MTGLSSCSREPAAGAGARTAGLGPLDLVLFERRLSGRSWDCSGVSGTSFPFLSGFPGAQDLRRSAGGVLSWTLSKTFKKTLHEKTRLEP